MIFTSIYSYIKIYTGWKGNKCRPFNSRRGRLKGPKNVYTIWGLNLIVLSEKGVSYSALFTSYCLAYIVRDNAKKITSVGISYMGLILFSKIFYVFDLVYVKSSSISN